jgi:hypothetical protein
MTGTYNHLNRKMVFGVVAAIGMTFLGQAQQYPPPQQPYPPPQPQQQYPAQQYPPPPGQPYPQPAYGPAPRFYPEQLDNLVSRFALYPDPLLAQILAAATYYDQIPDAAGWANAHRYVTGDALARAISDDRLPWNPSIIALIPFPDVLNAMASDMGTTQQLGNAVLAQRPEVMDAVQRMRQRALDYGYLRDTPEQRVIMGGPGNIQIVPASPSYYYVPVYDPRVVYVRPVRPYAGVVIHFGPRVYIGAGFAPWGWSNPFLDWRAHTVIIQQHPFERGWDNRARYVHPYVAPHYDGPRAERHEREVRAYEHDHDRSHDRR